MTYDCGARYMALYRRILAEAPPVELRNQVAMKMFRAWYVSFYYYGVIHGDPHLGNYTMTDSGQVNLMDSGCIRRTSSQSA